MTLERAAVAALIDHTLLKPEATLAQVESLCREANELGVFAVCVSPSMLPLGNGWLDASVRTACVVGFPSGAHHADIKAAEAARAASDGAGEIDMVINLGAAHARQWALVAAEVAAVRRATPGLLKVIIESAALDDEGIVEACRAAIGSGADFVKTSTGFHPSGGATVHAVQLMRATVGPDIGVKASGGVRTAEAAAAMIEAGATRIGTSSSAAILAALG
jgi:deoxyribose-phosphate aldolase